MNGNTQQPQQDGVRVRMADGAEKSRDTLSMSIEGSLNISTLKTVWLQTLDPIRKGRPKSVVIDFAGLINCDGAGLGRFGFFHDPISTPRLNQKGAICYLNANRCANKKRLFAKHKRRTVETSSRSDGI